MTGDALMEKMKTAVFGCGKISDIYIINMQKSEILDVCCIAASCIENTYDKAGRYGLQSRTIEDILEDKCIELIVNLTPPLAHFDLIKKSLLAGKHVFTEKVLAASLEEARELIKLADKKGLYLGCAPETFLGGAIQAAKRTVDSGTIGMVTGCQASFNMNLSEMYPFFKMLTKKGAGIGMDRGVYFLTALCAIMGPVAEVCGFVRTLNPVTDSKIESENQMVASVKFKSGVLGTLNFNGNSVFPEVPELVIQGQEGMLHLPDPINFGGRVTLLKFGQWSEVCYESKYTSDSRGIGPVEMAYAIRSNEKDRTSKEMAFHILEVFEAIEKSSVEKRYVTIESDFQIPENMKE